MAAIAAGIGRPLGSALPAFAETCPEILVQIQEADAARQPSLLVDRGGGHLAALRRNSPRAFGDIGVLLPLRERSSALDCFVRFLDSSAIGSHVADEAAAKLVKA